MHVADADGGSYILILADEYSVTVRKWLACVFLNKGLSQRVMTAGSPRAPGGLDGATAAAIRKEYEWKVQLRNIYKDKCYFLTRTLFRIFM